MRVFRKREDQYRVFMGLLFVIMIAISLSGGILATSTVTVENDVEGTMKMYGDDQDGNFYELTSVGARVRTQLKIVVDITSAEGLNYMQARVYVGDHHDPTNKGDLMVTQKLSAITELRYETIVDVDGYPTGYYLVVIRGVADTYEDSYDTTNPNWDDAISAGYDPSIVDPEPETLEADLKEMVKNGAYGGVWPIPEMITVYETKSVCDVYMPEPELAYVENPWQDIEFTFTKTQTAVDSEVTFDLVITTGSISSYVMTIYNLDWDRIVETDDIENFVFNVEHGQSDDTYTAQVNIIGATGWNGGNKKIEFTIDNPDDISGIVNFYIMENERWVEATDVLKDNIKVTVTNIEGNPSRIFVLFEGSRNVEYELSEGSDKWQGLINTRELPNGDYDIKVYAEREEDGAICYLSAWDVDVQGHVEEINMILFVVGMMGLIMVVMTDPRMRKRI